MCSPASAVDLLISIAGIPDDSRQVKWTAEPYEDSKSDFSVVRKHFRPESRSSHFPVFSTDRAFVEMRLP